jgi:hypothetical protein
MLFYHLISHLLLASHLTASPIMGKPTPARRPNAFPQQGVLRPKAFLGSDRPKAFPLIGEGGGKPKAQPTDEVMTKLAFISRN